MTNGLYIAVVKEETDELIGLLEVGSRTDEPFVVGDAIEKDGYKFIVTKDELVFEEYFKGEVD